jgi:hypothetical protein
MEIKRTGGLTPARQPEATGPSKPAKTEFGAAPQASAAGTVSTSGSWTQTVAAEFRKTDLKDPARLEQMLAKATDGLLAAQPMPLDDSQRKAIGEWMRNDPVFQHSLIAALEKVLK